MEFVKFHGYGNDYIVCEAKQLAGVADVSDFVRRICDRHYGAGADGVATLEGAANGAADFVLRIFNPDGSEAAMSGNGSRSAARGTKVRLCGRWRRRRWPSTRCGV